MSLTNGYRWSPPQGTSSLKSRSMTPSMHRDAHVYKHGVHHLDPGSDLYDPVTLSSVPAHSALYIVPNVPANRRVRHVYSYATIGELLQRGNARSPMTRRRFTSADIRMLAQ